MRRSKGEGSYSYDGEFYRFRVTSRGVEHSRSAKSRKELDALVKVLKKQLKAGINPAAKLSTAAYLGMWIDNIVRPTLAKTTYRGYEQKVRLYLVPTIGKIPLTELTSGHIRMALEVLEAVGRPSIEQLSSSAKEAMKEMEGPPNGPLSEATVTGTLVALTTALNHALTEVPPLLTVNPAAVIKRRPIQPKPKRTIAPTRSEDFIKSCEGTSKGDALIVMVTTGLRESEMLGLWVDDLALDAAVPYLVTKRALEPRKRGEEPKYKDTKGHKDRVITLNSLAVAALRRLKDNAERIGAKHVICSDKGEPIYQSTLYKVLQVRLKRAKMTKSGLHDLRKTYGTVLARSGVPLHVTQVLLGHEDPKTTAQHYLEVIAEDMALAGKVSLLPTVKEGNDTSNH